MQYFGGKQAIAKHILPIMLKARGNRPWVEPFVGSAGVIEKVRGGIRIGGDANPYVIALLKAVRDGWDPPEYVSKEQYELVKANKDAFSPEYVAYIGIGLSYAGKWFDGYDGEDREHHHHYHDHSKRALIASRPLLQKIDFYHADYRDLEIPRSSLIYCDPPYANTCGYPYKLDHGDFWEWCFEKATEGHLVFVSEYSAPDGVSCVLEIRLNISVGVKDGKSLPRIERLYCLDPTVKPRRIPKQLSLFDRF